MQLLKDRILKDGYVVSGNILKVDSFLNHQIDGRLMKEIGIEFKNRFADQKIDKVLTIEASGIAIAVMTSMVLDVPMVFAKKKKPSTMGDAYTAVVHSFTKGIDYDITVAKEFINEGENILIVDDFLANGHAALGLAKLVKDANANVAGIGIVIEKGFQNGSKLLKDNGFRVESLAIIDKLEDNKIYLK